MEEKQLVGSQVGSQIGGQTGGGDTAVPDTAGAEKPGTAEDRPGETVLPEMYEAKLARLQEDHAAALEQVKLDGELRYLLARMGAKNPLVAAKAVDLSGVGGAEEGFRGLEESVKRLMESDPYLFVQTSGIGEKLASGGMTGGVHGTVHRDPDMLSDAEYYREFGMPPVR